MSVENNKCLFKNSIILKLRWLLLKTRRLKALEIRLRIIKALTRMKKALPLYLYILSN